MNGSIRHVLGDRARRAGCAVGSILSSWEVGHVGRVREWRIRDASYLTYLSVVRDRLDGPG